MCVLGYMKQEDDRLLYREEVRLRITVYPSVIKKGKRFRPAPLIVPLSRRGGFRM